MTPGVTVMRHSLALVSTVAICACGVPLDPVAGPDASAPAQEGFAITGITVLPSAVQVGGEVEVSVELASIGAAAVSGASVVVSVVPPTGIERSVEVEDVSLAAGERTSATAIVGSLDQSGLWTVYALLQDSSGQKLADGPAEGAGLTVNPAATCESACAGEQPVCDPVARACRCDDASCLTGKTCDETTGACVEATCSPACSGETPFCEPTSKACQCTASSCGSGKTCTGGKCAVAGETRTLAEVVDAATRVKAWCQANLRLPNYVTMGTTQVPMPSFLKLVVEATLELNAGKQDALALPGGVEAPAAPQDDTVQGQIQKAEYLKIAADVKAHVEATNQAPGFASQTSLGDHLGFTNLVYMYSKIVAWSGANSYAMPAYVTLDLFSKSLVTNPLSPIVGYQQVDLSSDWGSCGSHSGGVAIAHLRGLSTVADATAVENALYWTYGGRVLGGPGRSDLASTYNKYLSAKGAPYTAFLFTDSDSVLGCVNGGTPVVAHVTLWGGHYVCIYGLVQESGVWKVYFSDGAFNDGVSATLPTGYLKKWSWSTFKSYLKSGYIGFKHN